MSALMPVHVGNQPIEDYVGIVGEGEVTRLRELAEPLIGKSVLYLNATNYGGGVAELLRSLLPMLRDLGIDAEWRVIYGEHDFFEVTKALHNALQGGEFQISDSQWRSYLATNRENAAGLEGEFDCIVVNDPQPAAIVKYSEHDARWVWRCHIDTSEPNEEAWRKLKPYIDSYDARVFSMPQFAPDDLTNEGLHIIPPAIDPLSPKNLDITWRMAGSVLRWMGIDLSKPIVCQVARFDPWKDPFGVVDAYRLAKQEAPELQLVLAGSMASDDPEGWRVHSQLTEYVEGDPDVYIASNYTGVGNIEVNAFQRLSQVIVQKSVREGFGLVVSEALYKRTPVVAGNVGGIPAQLRDGRDGYLVESIQECGERILELVRRPDLAREMGSSGRKYVEENFLITRLLADELELVSQVMGLKSATAAA